MKNCPDCNNQVDDASRFCDICGKAFSEQTSQQPQPLAQVPASDFSEAKPPKKGLNTTAIVIIIITAVLVIAGGVLLILDATEKIDFINIIDNTEEDTSEEESAEDKTDEDETVSADSETEETSEEETADEATSEEVTSGEDVSADENAGEVVGDAYINKALGLSIDIPEGMVFAEEDSSDARIKEFFGIETPDGNRGIGLFVFETGASAQGYEKLFLVSMTGAMKTVLDMYEADYETESISGYSYAGKTFERTDVIINDAELMELSADIRNMSMWVCSSGEKMVMIMIFGKEEADFDAMAELLKEYP